MNAARFFIACGALVMAFAVAGGAYAAHAARFGANPDARRLVETAVLYMLVHGIGIALIGVLARFGASRWLLAAGSLLIAGVVLFCGSLWMVALTGISPGVAPAGGVAFILGWLCVAVYALRQPTSSS